MLKISLQNGFDDVDFIFNDKVNFIVGGMEPDKIHASRIIETWCIEDEHQYREYSHTSREWMIFDGLKRFDSTDGIVLFRDSRVIKSHAVIDALVKNPAVKIIMAEGLPIDVGAFDSSEVGIYDLIQVNGQMQVSRWSEEKMKIPMHMLTCAFVQDCFGRFSNGYNNIVY